jgi:tetratricopeptide (TPR) repeat protein
MKNILFAATTLSIISFSVSTQAENLTHLNQLLATKNCSRCDLANSGLVMADLSGGNLSGANLVNANLSQANLSGIDLSGANLTGASLFGANLTGANLTGANLTGTDLRNAYLINTNLTDVDLSTAHIEGAKGISETAGTPEQFYRWAVRETERGNYRAAVEHYNRAINIDPEFAPAYLGIGLIEYGFDNRVKAQEKAEIAANLFKKQDNKLGYETSQDFLHKMELIQTLEAENAQKNQETSNFGKFIGGLGSLMLRLLF